MNRPEKTEAEQLYDRMLGQLKEGTRKHRNVEILWQALNELRSEKVSDYAIARVGARVEKLDGPKTQSLRNKDGAHFRQLIEAFAKSDGIPLKKSPVRPVSQAELAIEQIANLGARTALKIAMADYRRLKSENDRLRHAFKSLSVDSTKLETSAKTAAEKEEQATSLTPIQLDRSFLQSVATFLEKKWLVDRHFRVEPDGSIINQLEGNRLIAPPGFADGLQRLAQAGQMDSFSLDPAALRSFEKFLSKDWLDELGFMVESDGSIVDQTDNGRLIAAAGFANGLRLLVQIAKKQRSE